MITELPPYAIASQPAGSMSQYQLIRFTAPLLGWTPYQAIEILEFIHFRNHEVILQGPDFLVIGQRAIYR